MPPKSRKSRAESQASSSTSSSQEPLEHIPRPPNAFMLYRSHLWDKIKASLAAGEGSSKDQTNFSKAAGQRWGQEPAKVRKYWEGRAAAAKAAHKERYPDYKYSPRKAGEPKPKRKAASGRKKRAADARTAGGPDAEESRGQEDPDLEVPAQLSEEQEQEPLHSRIPEGGVWDDDVQMLSDLEDYLDNADPSEFAVLGSASSSPPHATRFDWAAFRQDVSNDCDTYDAMSFDELSEELMKMEEDYIDFDGEQW